MERLRSEISKIFSKTEEESEKDRMNRFVQLLGNNETVHYGRLNTGFKLLSRNRSARKGHKEV